MFLSDKNKRTDSHEYLHECFQILVEPLGNLFHYWQKMRNATHFLKGSFRMAYKRGHKNLKEILAPSTISTLEGELGRNSKTGQCKKCQKCGTSERGRKTSNGLNNCAVLEEGNTFCSKVTKEKYKIRQEINCRSRNVIYLVNCMKMS